MLQADRNGPRRGLDDALFNTTTRWFGTFFSIISRSIATPGLSSDTSMITHRAHLSRHSTVCCHSASVVLIWIGRLRHGFHSLRPPKLQRNGSQLRAWSEREATNTSGMPAGTLLMTSVMRLRSAKLEKRRRNRANGTSILRANLRCAQKNAVVAPRNMLASASRVL